MEKSPFFRTDLEGHKVSVSWQEMHEVRRDILLYFENNLDEDMNVLIVSEYAKLKYAKYLSVSYEEEYAESERYVWLCERGSLALLNGMTLDALTEPLWEGCDLWKIGKDLAQLSLPHLHLYEPTDESLAVGRELLINSLEFISQMGAADLNESGEVNFSFRAQGKWFTKYIVGDYFRSTAKLDFG